MHAWEAIQQTVDYLEEHLQEEICANDLAKSAGLSPFYFQRLFKRLVNKPLQEYVKLRRLAKAVDALNMGNQRILDIALDYGFSSHANFTRAFKDAYGITPEAYKKERPFLNTFLKPAVSMGYVTVDEGVPLIAGDIILEIRRETLQVPELYLGLSADVPIAAQTPVGESTGVDYRGNFGYGTTKKKRRLNNTLRPISNWAYLPQPIQKAEHSLTLQAGWQKLFPNSWAKTSDNRNCRRGNTSFAP